HQFVAVLGPKTRAAKARLAEVETMFAAAGGTSTLDVERLGKAGSVYSLTGKPTRSQKQRNTAGSRAAGFKLVSVLVVGSAMRARMRPDDIRKISNEAEVKKAQEYLARAKKQEEEQKIMRELFMREDEVPPEAVERVNHAVRRAAQQGLYEVQVFSFPASYCS